MHRFEVMYAVALAVSAVVIGADQKIVRYCTPKASHPELDFHLTPVELLWKEERRHAETYS
jgi:hypothetical protein